LLAACLPVESSSDSTLIDEGTATNYKLLCKKLKAKITFEIQLNSLPDIVYHNKYKQKAK